MNYKFHIEQARQFQRNGAPLLTPEEQDRVAHNGAIYRRIAELERMGMGTVDYSRIQAEIEVLREKLK